MVFIKSLPFEIALCQRIGEYNIWTGRSMQKVREKTIFQNKSGKISTVFKA